MSKGFLCRQMIAQASQTTVKFGSANSAGLQIHMFMFIRAAKENSSAATPQPSSCFHDAIALTRKNTDIVSIPREISVHTHLGYAAGRAILCQANSAGRGDCRSLVTYTYEEPKLPYSS